ncbi:MAG: protein-export membrane protein SecD [Deltaproteobacteria bacterium RIFCSPLOWO2_12_FULL_44_12]|nr:MAG: protein-export membrane protein SecD [Deltaproteobacteria bacterium RIFCSPLOWO2_12_FULL_44_12]
MLGSVVLAIYALVPTFFKFPQIRQELESQQKPIPWYFDFFPEKGLNLGLDLRGGIYIEMDVMVEEGIATKVDLLAQDLLRDLKKRNIEPADWKRDPASHQLQFTFKSDSDLQTTLELVAKDYKTALVKKGSTLQPQPMANFSLDPEYESLVRKDVVSQAVQAVRNRIDRYGLSEPTVQQQGDTRLIVELPGVKDPERAIKVIQQAGKLEFKLVSGKLESKTLGDLIGNARKENNLPIAYSADDVKKLNEILNDKLPEGTEIAFELTRDSATGQVTQALPYLLEQTSYITGDMLKNAQVQIDPQTSQPYVSLTFSPEGAKNFGELTKAHVKELLAIMLDGNVMSAPQIREPILNGQCKIDLGGNLDRQSQLKEAKDLTLVLQEGALPARLQEATKTVIGPTLGADSIQKSLKAMLIGTLLVVIFMVVYYNLSGLLADAAVLINTLFIFALLAMFQATLTLPGMAGIALTIGMAVDANVLIFERIRDELKAGQQPRAAVEAGYSNAVRAIMDSNLTTIIAGIILYQFGTGPIRGFAVTLMIGLMCNLLTAVTMTKTVYEFFLSRRKIARISI